MSTNDDRPGCGCLSLGLVVMGVLSVLMVLAIQRMGPARDDAGVITDSGPAAVDTFQPGDCLRLGGAEERIAGTQALPCDRPHEAQVYATGYLPEGDFPTQEQIGEAVASRCGDALEKIPADVSVFDLSSLNPTADTWRYGRGYSCLLVVPGGGTATGDALISPGA